MSEQRRVHVASKRTGRRRARRGRSLALGLSLAVAVVMGGVLMPAAALATPIALDAPDNGTPPLLAFDPLTGTTYVAWSDPTKPAVDLCVLPSGATSCEGGAPVVLTDAKVGTASNALSLGGLVVLPNGEAVVIGTPNTNENAVRPAGYEDNDGSIAWISPAGGSEFLKPGQGLQNNGQLISPVSLFYTFGNAAALNDTDVGLLNDYGDFVDDSSLTSAAPNIATSNSNPGGYYPRKALFTNGPEVAAEPAPPPAAAGTDVLVGVGDNYGGPSEALPGCLNKEGSGYGVSAGKVQGTSNGSGTLNSKGLPAYGLLECYADSPVLAQGGAGIGVLEQQGSGVSGAGSEFTLDYRPFDATATGGSFGPPVELSNVTQEVLDGVDALDLSEDSGTGVYALWEDGQTVIDYSANGGANWGGPVTSPVPYTAHGVIAGVGAGNALIAWNANSGGLGEQVFVELVNYQALAAAEASKGGSSPAPDTLTTSQTSGATTGASITISAGTVGETDRATINGVNGAVAAGNMGYALYTSPSCVASSEVFNGGSAATVTNGLAAPSAPVTAALAPGSYYWQATYGGDPKNASSVSTCGSEVLTVVPASTTGGSGTSNGTSVTITVTCASTPCTVTVTITISEASASAARKGKKHHKPKIVTIASGTFTIHTGGPKKLSVRLTKAGKKLLASHHGHLGAKVLIADKTAGGIEKTTRSITITTVKPKHKHKK